jgi:hypothetical protein
MNEVEIAVFDALMKSTREEGLSERDDQLLMDIMQEIVLGNEVARVNGRLVLYLEDVKS